MNCWLCVTPLILASSLALPAQEKPNAPCEAKSEWLLHVQKLDTGWSIGNIDQRQKLKSAEAPLNGLGSQRVVITDYRIRNPYFTFTEVLADSCNHSASLHTRQLRLMRAYGFAVNGKTFAFALFGNCGEMGKKGWIAAACDTYVTLVDTTGSGKFDTLEIGKPRPDSVPKWVATSP